MQYHKSSLPMKLVRCICLCNYVNVTIIFSHGIRASVLENMIFGSPRNYSVRLEDYCVCCRLQRLKSSLASTSHISSPMRRYRRHSLSSPCCQPRLQHPPLLPQLAIAGTTTGAVSRSNIHHRSLLQQLLQSAQRAGVVVTTRIPFLVHPCIHQCSS